MPQWDITTHLRWDLNKKAPAGLPGGRKKKLNEMTKNKIVKMLSKTPFPEGKGWGWGFNLIV
jgi:hypothetical protein